MIKRRMQKQIEQSLHKFPVVGLIGARQVGKTTLAKMIAETWQQKTLYLDLELLSDLAKLSEPQLYLQQYSDHLVILDEIQRKPELFTLLRALVDKNRRAGQYMLLGSASPDLIRESSESLAGRIIYFELSPFSLGEIKPEENNIRKLWSRGGYPRSFLADNDPDSMQWRQAFIQTHLERDIPNLGLRVPASAIRRFWQMLAHCHGQLHNAAKIASSLGVSSPTVRHYLDILQDTFMLRQLQPFHLNIKKRLVKSPKIYLRDSGLLHSLLGIENYDQLLGHPCAGLSWEGWAIEQILAASPQSVNAFFYRTSAGAETDMVLQSTGKDEIVAIEIKYSLDPKPAKGFRSAVNDLKPKTSFVIYPGNEFYPISENIFALPISRLDRITQTAKHNP